MIDAYVVRDPQGRVIGLSLSGYSALDEALRVMMVPPPIHSILRNRFNNEGTPAEYRGYTLKREQVNL